MGGFVIATRTTPNYFVCVVFECVSKFDLTLPCLGLDLMDFAPKLMGSGGGEPGSEDGARKFMAMRRLAKPMQDTFTSIEKVRGSTTPHTCSFHYMKNIFL